MSKESNADKWFIALNVACGFLALTLGMSLPKLTRHFTVQKIYHERVQHPVAEKNQPKTKVHKKTSLKKGKQVIAAQR